MKVARAIFAFGLAFSGGALAQAPVTARVEPDPVRAFVASAANLQIDGLNYYVARGTPTASVNGNTLTVELNSDCGFLCPAVQPQTFKVTLPPMVPGDYQVAVYGGYPSRHLVDTTLTVTAGPNYQGLWWASPAGVESGWGVQIAHQGATIFATWYTYDHDGGPTWLVIPDARRMSDRLYSGALYRTAAAPSQGTFNLKASRDTIYEGSVFFEFTDPDNGTFWYDVAGQQHAKQITRQAFAASPHCTYSASAAGSSNYQDLWWSAPAGSEPGWGVQIAHQSDTLFATFFGYDAQGKGLWLVMPDGRLAADGTYSGTVYSTRGPAYSANPWRPEDVSAKAEGTAEFSFSGSALGTFKISPAGGSNVSAQKAITRQEFSQFKTACN